MEKDSKSLLKLLEGKEWPNAIFPQLVYSSENLNQQQSRASSIFDQFFDNSLQSKKVLDYGCGEGFLTLHIAQAGAKFTVGYDIKQGKHLKQWEQPAQNYLLTNQYGKVKEQAPYDIIILYDVIDHLVGENIYELLEKINNLSKKGTIIILRCHPWTSRKSEPQLNIINKAFSKLILSANEAAGIGIGVENTYNKFSLSDYRAAILDNPLHFMPTFSLKHHPIAWLKESIVEIPVFFETACKYFNNRSKKNSTFTVRSEYIHRLALESFFQNKIINKRMQANLNKGIFRLPFLGNLWLRSLLEITYVDYTLVVN